jgi:hypothetical protein
MAGALGACLVLTLALKIGFHACGNEIPGLAIRSPSGHSAFSTTVYGCGALLLGSGRSNFWRFWIVLATLGLIGAIAVSRVTLHAHSEPEVLAGLVVGFACIAFFRLRTAGAPDIAGRWRLLFATFAMLAVLTHGQHLNAEGLIQSIAHHLRGSVGICEMADPE